MALDTRTTPRMLTRLVAGALIALTLLPVVAEARKLDPRTAAPTELYEQGLKYMRRGYYTRAQEMFNAIRNYHRDDPISIKAQLAIADMYFKKSEWEQARYAYEEFSTYHPRHPDMDYVTFRIGLSIYKRASLYAGRDQTATRGAVNVWTGFDTRFPESEHAEDTTKYIRKSKDRLARKELFVAKHYMRRNAWGAVRSRCEYLVRRYPDSEAVPEALTLLGTSMHAWGDVEAAADIRQRLSESHPESKWLARLDRALAKDPGEKPKEEVFIRPYRVRAPTGPGGQPQ